MKRRDFIAATSVAAVSALSSCNRNDSGKIKLGFIPLTDCASLVMAHELGLFKKHGVDVQVTKEASWASIRDKILTGELDGAHCLFGMPFSVYTGVGGQAGRDMYIAMILNNNGQAITLSKEFCDIPFRQFADVHKTVDMIKSKKTVTFAMTFPGGTHDIWLRYWLSASGIDQKVVKVITIPPPQMVANMKVKNMDGYCVGEPWNGVAVKQGIGYTHISSQDIWKNHPEKALVVNKAFKDSRKDELKAVMKAVLEASAWLDDMSNRKKAAEIIGRQSYVNAPADVIEARLLGKYDLGCAGSHTYKDDFMMFHRGGLANYPRKSHGMWYMAQYVRFGYLKTSPDTKAIAERLILQDLYKEVAAEMKLPIPDDDMKPFTIDLDKSKFDPLALA